MILAEYLQNQNVRAFLRMIRHGEGTSDDPAGYSRMFGGKHFTDFSRHPNEPQTYKSGSKVLTSTAAGAFQFLTSTWSGLVNQYKFPDFSPASQDMGAVALIIGRKAIDDVIAGRFEDAVRKTSKEWASLPGSPYGQPTVTMAKAREVYVKHGGTFMVSPPLEQFAPADAPRAAQAQRFIDGEAQPQPEKPMAPFLLAALPSILEAVPKLASLFGGGSEVAERNVKAIETVVGIAKEAVGAANEQALVETLKTDPEAARVVQQAVEEKWFTITSSMADVEKAREANAAAVHFWTQPAFWITMSLMPMVYFVAWRVLMSETFASEMQAMVIGTIIGGVLGSITSFWLGSSFSSARKTELAAGK